MIPLAGVLAAAVTPRRPSGHEIDLAAALDVVEYLSQSGVAGIALLGCTGEFVHFDFEERMRLVSMARRVSRVPLVVNVSHSTLDGAVGLAEEAASAGAAAVLLLPPHFFAYDAETVRSFYQGFVHEVDSDIPVYLYNVPFFTNELPATLACELLATGRFAGVKDSSGDPESLQLLLRQRSQTPFTLLLGNDVLFTSGLQAGADGVISGCACAVPELMLALHKAIAARDENAIARCEPHLREFLARVDRLPTPVGIKAALSQRGVHGGAPAVPPGQELQRELDEFGEWFRGWLPGMLQDARTS